MIENFELQKQFRERLEQQGNSTTRKNLLRAYLVEVFEWYNETATFKSWKKQKPLEIAVTTENADVLAFSLELAISAGYTADEYRSVIKNSRKLIQQQVNMFKNNDLYLLTHISNIVALEETENATNGMQEILCLPYSMAVIRDVSYTALLKAHIAKMGINNNRQDNDY